MVAGRYRIGEVIGRGGMGVVYIAQDEAGDGRIAVVKVLAPQFCDNEEFIARFDREARRLRGLHHPNVVELYDHGSHEGMGFIVMEFIEGESLGQFLKREGPLTLSRFVPIAAQILKAAGHAHTLGIMIRDIKPANLMLTVKDGRAHYLKMLDFGLARAVGDADKVTREQLVGTASYLAPEQIRGEALDVQVDVYAIGVLFYQLLTGRLPFAAESAAALLYKHVNEEPPDLLDHAPPEHELPAALGLLVSECMAKDKTMRPVDGNAVMEHLIDAVPARLFRLPRVDGGARESIATMDRRSIGGAGQRPTPIPGHETRPARALESTQIQPQPAERTSNRMPLAVLAVAVLVLLLGGGTLAMSAFDRGPDTEQLLDGVRHAEQLVGDGDFPEALAELSALEPSLQSEPNLLARAQLAKDRAECGLLFQRAQAQEETGQNELALQTYREVLRREPGSDLAKAAVKRLQVAEDAEPDESADATLKLDATPVAEVFVDGQSIGRTPVSHALSAGVHRIRVRAANYESWEEEVDLQGGRTLDKSVALRPVERRGTEESPAASSRRRRDKARRQPAPIPESEPETEPEPMSVPKITPGDEPNPGFERLKKKSLKDF